MSQDIGATMALPDSESITAYLKNTGWMIEGSGPIGSLWYKNEFGVGVPHGGDDELIEGVIDRIAHAERRAKIDVARSIRFRLFDITNLRANSDERIVDTIPLDTASKIITSARTMFRTVATTARRERAEIAGSYSKIGDEVVHETLMGHTERGSFVIPVLVPVPEPQAPDFHQPTLDHENGAPSFHTAPPEPFERRVVRTFAQSLQALRELVVEPAHDPTANQIQELVYRGVSREFCTALSEILSERTVGEFEAHVEWAAALQAPGRVADSITISAAAVDLVDRTARKLRYERPNPNQTFSGTIVQLRHSPDDGDYGEVSISTLRRGKPTEIIVRLPISVYEQAWEWHLAGRAVLVQGKITSGPGRRQRVERFLRFHPLDEMFIPEVL